MEAESIVMDGFRFEPVRFHSAVPLPPPQCTLPLPEGCRLGTEECPKEECQEGENKGLLSGAMHTLSALLGTSALALEKTKSSSSNTKLRDRFPEIENSRIVCEHQCILFTQNGELPGSLCLTTNHLLFIPQNPNATDICIPFADILSFQRLINCKEAVANAPHFDCCLDETRAADALQFFVCTGQLYIFKEFLLQSNIDDCLNVFDHLWRSTCEVPCQNRKYIPSEQFIQPLLIVTPPSVVDAKTRRRNRRRSNNNNEAIDNTNTGLRRGNNSPNKQAGRNAGDRRGQSAFHRVQGANRELLQGPEVPVPPANVSRSQSTEELDTWRKVQQSDKRREGVLAEKHEELKPECNNTCNQDGTNLGKTDNIMCNTCNTNNQDESSNKQNINEKELNRTETDNQDANQTSQQREPTTERAKDEVVKVHPLMEEPLSERLLTEQLQKPSEPEKTEA